MATKAKSQKSCGLNPLCYIGKAVDSIKATMQNQSTMRNKRINKRVSDAVAGKAGT